MIHMLCFEVQLEHFRASIVFFHILDGGNFWSASDINIICSQGER